MSRSEVLRSTNLAARLAPGNRQSVHSFNQPLANMMMHHPCIMAVKKKVNNMHISATSVLTGGCNMTCMAQYQSNYTARSERKPAAEAEAPAATYFLHFLLEGLIKSKLRRK